MGSEIDFIKMYFTKKEHKKFNKKDFTDFILGGDIGGTNINFGVFGVKNGIPELLFTLHSRSSEFRALQPALDDAFEHIKRNISMPITRACLAIAGALSQSRDYGRITNTGWNVSRKNLIKRLKLKSLLLINDFEAVGYGISLLAERSIVVIKKAKKAPKAPVLVIGAGTGLGKTTLIYSEKHKFHVPVPSEAGHSDFAAQSRLEAELIEFIKRHKKIKQNVSYEQVLSGQGLSNIYMFLRKNKKFPETACTKEIDKAQNQPELISKYRKIDKTCSAAFGIFKAAYARFAKNFALDCLALGGVYIAGGIAPKNKDIFDSDFVKTFERNYKVAGILKKMPIYLVLDCNVGLLGAGFACARFLREHKRMK